MRQVACELGGKRFGGVAAAMLGCLVMAGCSATPTTKTSSRFDPRLGVSASPRVIEPGQPVPKGGGTYRVGKPYVVAGRTYVPQDNKNYRGEGVGSWYGDDFHGRLTANGEIYDMDAISAAHPTLPMPSYARVTNLRSGRSLIVRVNDRGPYHADREIDLSRKAAELLDYRGKGLAKVRVEYVGPAPLEGSDDRRLLATLRETAPGETESRVALARSAPAPAPMVAAKPAFPEPQARSRPAALAEAAIARAPLEPARFEETATARKAGIQLVSDDPRRPAAARALPAGTRTLASADDTDRSAGPGPKAGVLGTMPVQVGRGLY